MNPSLCHPALTSDKTRNATKYLCVYKEALKWVRSSLSTPSLANFWQVTQLHFLKFLLVVGDTFLAL